MSGLRTSCGHQGCPANNCGCGNCICWVRVKAALGFPDRRPDESEDA